MRITCLLRLHCSSLRSVRRVVSSQFPTTSDVIDESAVPPSTVEKRALRVAVLGTPNVGKSALTNAVVRSSLCAVSKRIDTTRKNATASLTEDDCQLVVVDSPGLIGIKHAKDVVGTHTESNILVDPERAIQRAEHILVVTDPTMPGEYIHHRVLHLLYRYSHIPSSLVINKVDLVKRRTDLLRLAEILTEGVVDGQSLQKKTRQLGNLGSPGNKASGSGTEMKLHPTVSLENRDEKWRVDFDKLMSKPAHKCSWSETKHLFISQRGWPHFKAVFYVSALTNDGVDHLRQYLRSMSVPTEEWRYDDKEIVRKNSHQICEQHARSKLLDLLPPDIAYKLRVRVIEFEVFSDEARVIIDVDCEKERWAKMVAAVVERIETALRLELEKLFEHTVDKK
ncbi:putative GTP-binding protein [Aphelenchoides avenae]|nr:putative GTP-binding protein [Aphelenchus avenae]